MKTFSGGIILALATLTVLARNARYETVTAGVESSTNFMTVNLTRDITISDFETGEFVDGGSLNNGSASFFLIKDGFTYDAQPAATAAHGIGTKVRGPATFRMIFSGNVNAASRYMTVQITPVAFPPDKTVIIPPTTNQFQIDFQLSTNLVNWVAATNGVYGSPIEAQFFRLKMTKLN